MKFQDSSFNGYKVTVGTKKCDARTRAPKAICPTNFFKVGGIKTWSTMVFHGCMTLNYHDNPW